MTPIPKRILLVEDNRADVILLQEMLKQHAPGQLDLCVTSSLAETFAALQRECFDAILLDLSLPDSYGPETVTRVCAAAPTMPILVMTGLADEHIVAQVARHGADDCLVKGQTDARSIVRAIEQAIDRKQAADSNRLR